MLAYLKQSGELMTDDSGALWTAEKVYESARRIAELHVNASRLDLNGLMVVPGAGNIIRGAGLKREFPDSAVQHIADGVGRLGTAQNALVLSAALKDLGIDNEIFVPPNVTYSDMGLPHSVRPYDIDRVQMAFGRGRVAIMAYGDGRNNTTTDGAVVSYAVHSARVNPGEPHSVLKATRFNGIFEEDPRQNADARRYSSISAGHMLEDVERFAAVDIPCLEAMFKAPDNLTMQVYAAGEYTPYQVLSAPEAVGTLVLAGNVEPVLV